MMQLLDDFARFFIEFLAPGVPFIIMVGFFYILFWLHCFTQMMIISDSEYPGKYDKLVWGATFIVLFFLAPIAYLVWKYGYIKHCDEMAKRRLPDDPANDRR